MNRIKAIILLIILIGTYVVIDKVGNHYTISGTITEATETGCLIVDENGEGWYWEGEGFSAGDNVKIIMHTLETQTIYDDVIIKVKALD